MLTRANEASTQKLSFLNTLDIEGVERAFHLPKSYVTFCETYGFGRLCGYFLIFPPLDGFCDGLIRRSSALHRTLIESIELDLFDYEPHGSRELIERAIPFGISENGDFLFWDPSTQEAQNHECAIFLVRPKTLGVFRAGQSLPEFVERLCDESLVKEMWSPRANALEPTFESLDLVV